jgi:hypothetical protein
MARIAQVGVDQRGSRKRVRQRRRAEAAMVNTASCSRPSTPETKNVAYAMHVDSTPVASVGHNARTLAQGITPVRWWLKKCTG